LGDELVDYLPAGVREQAALKPIYEDIAGWGGSTKGARSWRDLPPNAVIYVRRIEELIGAPVVQVTTGPDRKDVIVMRDPFAG
jgi:adenylosuccinate synthase